MNKKAINIILKIIKKFFNNKDYNIKISQDIIPDLIYHIKTTNMGGIAYLALKNNPNIPKNLIIELKNRFQILKEDDKLNLNAFKAIKKTGFKKILIKENIYKYQKKYKYILGTRYSCDIDFFLNHKNIFKLFKELPKHKFYSENFLNFKRPEKLKKIAYKTNKDITYLPMLRESDKFLIKEKRYKEEKYDPKNTFSRLKDKTKNYIKKLNSIISLYDSIEKQNMYISKKISYILKNNQSKFDKNDLLNQKKNVLQENNFLKLINKKQAEHIKKNILKIENILNYLKENISLKSYEQEMDSYTRFILNLTNKRINQLNKLKNEIKNDLALSVFYQNGAFIELHFQMFKKNRPFQIDVNKFKTEKLFNNMYALKIEDSFILDACHYINIFEKKDKSKYPQYAFQGFLKYLTDILYKISLKKINWERVISLAVETNSSSQVWIYFKHAKKHLDAKIPNNVLKKLKNNGSKMQNLLLSLIPSKKLIFNEFTLPVKIYYNFYFKDGWIKKIIAQIHKFYNKLNNEKEN